MAVDPEQALDGGVEIDVAQHVDRTNRRVSKVNRIRRRDPRIAGGGEDGALTARARRGAGDVAADPHRTEARHALNHAVQHGSARGLAVRGIADDDLADPAVVVDVLIRPHGQDGWGEISRPGVVPAHVRAQHPRESFPDGDGAEIFRAHVRRGAGVPFDHQGVDAILDQVTAERRTRAAEAADEHRAIEIAFDGERAADRGARAADHEIAAQVVFEGQILGGGTERERHIRGEVTGQADVAAERPLVEGVVEIRLDAPLGQPVAAKYGGNVDAVLVDLDRLGIGPVVGPGAVHGHPACGHCRLREGAAVHRAGPEQRLAGGRAVCGVNEIEAAGDEWSSVGLTEVAAAEKDRLNLTVCIEQQRRNTGALGVDVADRDDILDGDFFASDTDHAALRGEDRASHADATQVGVTRLVLRIAREDDTSDVGETVVALFDLSGEEAGVLQDAGRVDAEVRVQFRLIQGDAGQTLDVVDLLPIEELVRILVEISGGAGGPHILKGDRHRTLAPEFRLHNVPAPIEKRHAHHFARIRGHGDCVAGEEDLVVDPAIERNVRCDLRAGAGDNRRE